MSSHNSDASTQLMSDDDLSNVCAKKRKKYSLETKINVLRFLRESELSDVEAERALDIPRRNILRWRTQYQDLESAKSSRKVPIRKRFRLSSNKKKRGKFTQIEYSLYEKICEHRANGLIVDTKWIRRTAKECASDLSISEDRFKVSNGWIQRFLNRFNLSLRTPTSVGQKDPDNAKELAFEFFHYFCQIRQKLPGYNIIYANLDEVPVWFDMPKTRTYDFCGNKTVKVSTTGNEKLRLTVVLCTLSNGKKVKPMIIFKSLKEFEYSDLDIYAISSKGGSMRSELMEKWRNKCWKIRDNYQIENVQGEKSRRKTVLIMDSAKCHLADELIENLNKLNNTQTKIIPGGMTKFLQPADIVYNKAFKSKLRDLWADWFQYGEVQLTRGGKRKPASKETVIEWVKSAFASISEQMIISSFEKCGILDEDASEHYHHRLLQLITEGSVETNEEDHSGITDYESDEEVTVDGPIVERNMSEESIGEEDLLNLM